MKRISISALLAIISFQFVLAGNERLIFPHQVKPKPSWSLISTSQDPSPATQGQKVTITWNIQANAGYHQDKYTQGDLAPEPKAITDWKIKGHGKVEDGETTFKMTTTETARGSSVMLFGLSTVSYNDPCTGMPAPGEAPPSAYHTFIMGPADPNHPKPHEGPTDDATDDIPGGTGGTGDSGGIKLPPERPDQGEAVLIDEIVDPSSFTYDVDRGSIPTRSDGYLVIKKTNPADTAMEEVDDVVVELTHRIVTINSPPKRDLKGMLKLDVEPGSTPRDYVVFHYDSGTGEKKPISLPCQIPITEPGHEGGGVHDWHAGYEHFSFRRIGDGALTIKITVDPDPARGASLKTAMLHLLPADVAVDANRDGDITFDGNDKTTAARPFRFWINNDQDDVEVDEPVLVTNPDYLSETITTKRDLEDFCRLKVNVGISNEALIRGDFKVGLKFRNFTGNQPSVLIWANQSPEGNLDYLTSELAAGVQQTTGTFFHGDKEHCSLIPASYWAGRQDAIANLIFEGVSKGTGELVVVIHDKNGLELGSGSGTWIKLLDVKEMYQRARIENEADEITEPWINSNPPSQVWKWDPNGNPYVEDPDADHVTAVFVHGWRMKYNDYQNYSDTSYKRLWHQGFRGKFYSFRWATYSGDNNGIPYGYDEIIEDKIFPPGGLTYNPSEYRAWLCGPALASFVNQLPYLQKRNLFAHSMGNVISGSALRAGMTVKSYAMCNAAMSAMAYDSAMTAPDCLSYVTPDTSSDPAIRAGYGLANKFNLNGAVEIFNFGLPNDEALGIWSVNNKYFKPQIGGYIYAEHPAPSPFNLTYYGFSGNFRQVSSLPEAMGYVTQSRSRAAGAELATGRASGGSVSAAVDMRTFGFGETHSAQWRWNNQSTHLFWETLVNDLELNP